MKFKTSKKPAAPKQSPKAKLQNILAQASIIFTKHAVVVMFVIAGATIGMALFRARSYLNPVREEARYQEGSSKNSYGKIDYTLVKRLEDSLSDATIKVNQSLDPNRKDPFSE